MHADTKFAPEITATLTSYQELGDFLQTHKAEEEPCFLEETVPLLSEKEFRLDHSGKNYRFTRPAFFQYCAAMGIPPKFADKIPNDLLHSCMERLVEDDNQKLRLVIRDEDVISMVHKENFILTEPLEFQEAAKPLLDTHQFREANVSDFGTTMLLEPYRDQHFDLPGDDTFNVGMAFSIGYGSGTLRARPYSLRHCCINVAITATERPTSRIVETIGKRKKASAYDRFLNQYNMEEYQSFLKELHTRIESIRDKPLMDGEYRDTFKMMNRLLGKEMSLAIIGVSKDQHAEILEDLKYREDRPIAGQSPFRPVEELPKFDVFNRITALAKNYTGQDRHELQLVGGALV
jgi:hypothetical protein